MRENRGNIAKEWKKSGCPFCALNCTLEVLVEDDHIIDVRPNPDSNKELGGYCCRKGRSVKYWQDNPERLNYPLKKVEQARILYDMNVMDEVFWAADAEPNGLVVGPVEPDPDKRARDHIFYPDKKIKLFDPVVDEAMKDHVPEKELAMNETFDLIISSGNHKDSGMDDSMRNPDTYDFRKPYELTMNPEDAAERGIKEGEVVRIVTSGGTMKAPVVLSYRANRGYAMVPHHFGYDTRKGRYGEPANAITAFEHRDMITGDTAVRYVPGRVEKIG